MFGRGILELLGIERGEAWDFVAAVLELIEAFFDHRWWSNTQLSVIAEAQGAEFVSERGRTFSHAQSLQEVLNRLANREDVIVRMVQRIQGRNRAVGNALFDVLRPAMDFSRQIRRVGANILARAAELRRVSPNRLDGVELITRERGRAGSVVRQLADQAIRLRQRNIDPRLVVDPSAAMRAAIAEAEALPADEREAILKVTPMIELIRRAIAQQLRQAVGEARAALRVLLDPLEVLLEFLARSLGGRLSSFFLIPQSVFKEILKAAGIRTPDAA